MFDADQEHNRSRWTAAIITYQLYQMFCGSGDKKKKMETWDNWAKSLGMIIPKKKSVIVLDKEAEIKKGNDALAKFRKALEK